MSQDTKNAMSVFERYLTLWVGLCIAIGILLGKIAPELAGFLDGMAISVNDTPLARLGRMLLHRHQPARQCSLVVWRGCLLRFS
jgi:ACR3 family arsenite efflux pump ArsB